MGDPNPTPPCRITHLSAYSLRVGVSVVGGPKPYTPLPYHTSYSLSTYSHIALYSTSSGSHLREVCRDQELPEKRVVRPPYPPDSLHLLSDTVVNLAARLRDRTSMRAIASSDKLGAAGGGTHVMHGRSSTYGHRPSHPCNAGTGHVGYSSTREDDVACNKHEA